MKNNKPHFSSIAFLWKPVWVGRGSFASAVPDSACTDQPAAHGVASAAQIPGRLACRLQPMGKIRPRATPNHTHD